MACDYGTLLTAAEKIQHQVWSLRQNWAQVSSLPLEVSCSPVPKISIALQVSCRCVQRSQHLQNLTILEVNNHSIMNVPRLLQVVFGAPEKALAASESTLLSSLGGPGSIWNYLGALVRSTRVSGRLVCGFWTVLHFAYGGNVRRWLYLSAFKENWLVVVDLEGKHTVSKSYIAWLVCHCVSEGKTENLGWMLYSVDAVFCVCCT